MFSTQTTQAALACQSNTQVTYHLALADELADAACMQRQEALGLNPSTLGSTMTINNMSTQVFTDVF